MATGTEDAVRIVNQHKFHNQFQKPDSDGSRCKVKMNATGKPMHEEVTNATETSKWNARPRWCWETSSRCVAMDMISIFVLRTKKESVVASFHEHIQPIMLGGGTGHRS